MKKLKREDDSSMDVQFDPVEMQVRMKMAMKIGGMDWWEWNIITDTIKSSLVKRMLFDLEPDLNENITSARYAEKIHRDDVELVKQAFEDLLLGHTEFFDAEYRIYDRKGQEKWLHDRGVIVSRSPDGKPLKVIGLVQDISHYKQIQGELMMAKQKAEEADRLKTAFLTNMSHEVRTPMNAIIGFSELLSDPGIGKEDIANYTRIIKNRSSHLLQIVNDILDISRIEANQVELKESSIFLNQVLDELYLFYAQKLIDEKKLKIMLTLEKSLEDENSVFRIDELRLRQVLGNLLDNALKFTQEGTIDFGYRLINGLFVFHVSDTGIGIPAEKHEVIFERFRQADASLARQFGGNGLGLAICKAFVELMGGRIWMESKPGQGSAFYFSIPTDRMESHPPGDKIINAGLTGFRWTGKRILLVEDDDHSAVFMRKLFTLTGVELIVAVTAREALQIFASSQAFDLVLMDIQLPDKNGIELMRLLKMVDARVPVIAQTAYAMSGDNIKCLQAGCDDYISKPINISDLFSKVNHYFSR